MAKALWFKGFRTTTQEFWSVVSADQPLITPPAKRHRPDVPATNAIKPQPVQPQLSQTDFQGSSTKITKSFHTNIYKLNI
jgi:hypothetical protein